MKVQLQYAICFIKQFASLGANANTTVSAVEITTPPTGHTNQQCSSKKSRHAPTPTTVHIVVRYVVFKLCAMICDILPNNNTLKYQTKAN